MRNEKLNKIYIFRLYNNMFIRIIYTYMDVWIACMPATDAYVLDIIKEKDATDMGWSMTVY